MARIRWYTCFKTVEYTSSIRDKNVHFERLKPHQSGPLEFATAQAVVGDIEVLMDPDPEHPVDVINDDMSQPSYKTEQLLSEASDVSLPSRGRHWILAYVPDFVQEAPECTTNNSTILPLVQTTNCLKSSCRFLPYWSMPTQSSLRLPVPQTTPYHPHDTYRHFSPTISQRALHQPNSLLGTSAPLLTNPSFTEFLSNYPIWPTDTQPRPASKGTDSDDPSPAPTIPSVLSGAGTAPSLKRGGRPPKPRKKRLVQPEARTRKKTPMRVTEFEVPTASEAPRYQIRIKRQPRYKCGTCGLPDSVRVLAANENRGMPIGVRGVPPEER